MNIAYNVSVITCPRVVRSGLEVFSVEAEYFLERAGERVRGLPSLQVVAN
jgi:hypothetical protein